jgi:hypothetical protein
MSPAIVLRSAKSSWRGLANAFFVGFTVLGTFAGTLYNKATPNM